jgi:hypothetical protein
MLKKLIGYLNMRIFLTFYTCSLTPLESVESKRVRDSGTSKSVTFLMTYRQILTFIMIYI